MQSLNVNGETSSSDMDMELSDCDYDVENFLFRMGSEPIFVPATTP